VILADSLSANLGDFVVRLLQNAIFMRLIGMYTGKSFQLNPPQVSQGNENPISKLS
jgi:hypothetical protein